MLVEIHGGKLRIASKLNEGTEVTVTFPGNIVIGDEVPREGSTSAPQIDAFTDRTDAAPERAPHPIQLMAKSYGY